MESRSVIENLSELLDYTAVRAPFLNKTLTKWRRLYWSTLPHTPETVAWLDHQILVQILPKAEARYFSELMESDCAASDFGLSKSSLNQMKSHAKFPQLAALMSRWAVEIELAWDIVDRAQLYGLYSVPTRHHEMFDNLRRDWSFTHDNIRERLNSFAIRLLSYGTDSVAAKMKKKLEEDALASLVSTKSAIIYGAVHAFMSGKVPWAVLTMLGSSASWLLGGMAIMQLGHSIHSSLSNSQLTSIIQELTYNFERLIDKLTKLTAKATSLIERDFGNSDSPELSVVLDKLFEHKHMEFSQYFDEHAYMDQHMTVAEEEDYLLVGLNDYSSGLLGRTRG